jgi:hypothetical protein
MALALVAGVALVARLSEAADFGHRDNSDALNLEPVLPIGVAAPTLPGNGALRVGGTTAPEQRSGVTASE